MTDHEKHIVAYHEIGHALVAAKQTNSAPVQKITLVPRTSGALGYTMQVDTADKNLMTKEEIEKDFDAFVKLFTWNYLQKYFIKQDNLTVTPEEATAEAKALAQAQFAQYGLPTAPEDMLANYAKKILEDREQGQKIYEKLYEMKVVEDVKSKIKVTEKAVSAEEFAKLAKEI